MPVVPVPKRGFTLIELLVVIAILGVLAAAVLVAINPAKRSAQARDSIRKSDFASMYNALEAFFVQNGAYPVTSAGGDYMSYSTEANWLSELGQDGVKKVPVDPKQSFLPFDFSVGNVYAQGEVLPATTAPVLDTSSSSISLNPDLPTTTRTWSHNVTANQNLGTILVVTVATRGGASLVPVSSVTYNGDSLTFVRREQTITGQVTVEIWYMLLPDMGNNSVVVTTSAVADAIAAGATSWHHVNQSNPIASHNSQRSASGNPNVTVSGVDSSNVVVDVAARPQGSGAAQFITASATGGQTELYSLQATNTAPGVPNEVVKAMSSYKYGSGNMSWNLSNTADVWASVAVALNFAEPPIVYDLPTPADGYSGSCPLTLQVYCYVVSSTGQNFTLWAKLEDKDDLEISNKWSAKCRKQSPNILYYNYCVDD